MIYKRGGITGKFYWLTQITMKQPTHTAHSKRNIFKGFTLVELMISTSIMGILFIIIFQIYVTIARLTVRIEQEKYVTQELVYAMQTIQNIVDTTRIDRSKYNLQQLQSNK